MKTGEVADFDRAEVDRFKQELKEGMTGSVTHGSIDASEAVRAEGNQETALAIIPPAQAVLVEHFAAMMEQWSVVAAAPPSKLMLSVPEASDFSGISEAHLRKAIHAGELKAYKGIGRGLGKVKRDDLLAYIRRL